MRPRALSDNEEAELYRLLELRRSLSNKKLMIRFGISASVLYRIATQGPRQSLNKITIESPDDARMELRA